MTKLRELLNPELYNEILRCDHLNKNLRYKREQCPPTFLIDEKTLTIGMLSEYMSESFLRSREAT